MLNKITLLITSLMLFACGVNNRQITPPDLALNGVATWHYICKDAYGLDVEYANMGGDYTATIYNKELPKRVLQRVAEGKFADGEWEWSQNDSANFMLINNNEVITSNCRSYSSVDDSGIVLLR